MQDKHGLVTLGHLFSPTEEVQRPHPAVGPMLGVHKKTGHQDHDETTGFPTCLSFSEVSVKCWDRRNVHEGADYGKRTSHVGDLQQGALPGPNPWASAQLEKSSDQEWDKSSD